MYRELYETQVGEADQAKRILAAEAGGEHVSVRWADDAMWATAATGHAPARATPLRPSQPPARLTPAGGATTLPAQRPGLLPHRRSLSALFPPQRPFVRWPPGEEERRGDSRHRDRPRYLQHDHIQR